MSNGRGLGVAAGLDDEVARELAARCEQLGYSSMWSNDTPIASGLETAAIFARSAALDAGVAVLALDRHAPDEIASKIAEVEIAPERLWLGIGAGFSERPLTTMRDGIDAVRAALPTGIRIAVAAMGPKMCALAGAKADGVFLNWPTPEKAALARERIHEGAAEAGRDRPPTIFGYVRAAVGTDAQARLLREESFYRELHQGYVKHFDALGMEPGTVGVAESDAGSVPAALASYEPAIDQIIVRALGSANIESLGAVAKAAAPASE